MNLIDAIKSERPDTPCWAWGGSRHESGYGVLYMGTGRKDVKYRVAHRVIWEGFHGPVPKGLELDHLCRNRGCVNPDHLEAVTSRVNNLRGMSPTAQHARQTHCKRGHEFTSENTLKHSSGGRRCKTCTLEFRQSHRARANATYRAWYARKKAAKLGLGGE